MKPKLTILIGIPASGKSTFAKQLARRKDTVRVNRDDLRNMLHGKHLVGKNFNIKLQRKLRHLEGMIVEYYLKRKTSVVIDDTNLTASTRNYWEKLADIQGADFETIKMDTPFETCVERNEKREHPVPIDEMKHMYYNKFKHIP